MLKTALLKEKGGIMLKLVKILEDMMVAVTFAEAGEFDQASKLMNAETPQDNQEAVPVTAET